MATNSNKVWYNNGVMEGMYDKAPQGWEKGRLVKSETKKFDVLEKVRQSNFTRPKRRS